MRSPDTQQPAFETELERVELLEPGATERELRPSINDLNHRLPYALGEYDEPPRPMAVPE